MGKRGPKIKPLHLKFWEHVYTEPNTGCWLWGGKLDTKGYGMITVPANNKPGFKHLRAHRVGYELVVGPIPQGLDLDHLCKVKCCVSPYHLEPVTRKENTIRYYGPRPFCKNGHELSGYNLRVNAKGHRFCRQCHREEARAAWWKKKEKNNVTASL